MATKKELTIDDRLEELGDIVDKLESDKTTLEDAFKLYEQGVKLIKETKDSIDKLEKAIKVVNE